MRDLVWYKFRMDILYCNQPQSPEKEDMLHVVNYIQHHHKIYQQWFNEYMRFHE